MPPNSLPQLFRNGQGRCRCGLVATGTREHGFWDCGVVWRVREALSVQLLLGWPRA